MDVNRFLGQHFVVEMEYLAKECRDRGQFFCNQLKRAFETLSTMDSGLDMPRLREKGVVVLHELEGLTALAIKLLKKAIWGGEKSSSDEFALVPMVTSSQFFFFSESARARPIWLERFLRDCSRSSNSSSALVLTGNRALLHEKPVSLLKIFLGQVNQMVARWMARQQGSPINRVNKLLSWCKGEGTYPENVRRRLNFVPR